MFDTKPYEEKLVQAINRFEEEIKKLEQVALIQVNLIV